ncbi:MAG: threonine synthase [Succinivibrio sp.]
MQLYNLKDHSESVNFTQAVLRGIGRGQGLFFPDRIEPFPQQKIDELLGKPLVPRSQEILRHLIGSDELPELEGIVADAFNFPCPLVKAEDGCYCLQLFRGPTLAFKDFGARFLARVLSAVRGGRHLTILTATSGDTGAAVAGAFHGQEGIDVVVMYPKGKITPLQEKLIATLGGNVHAIEVDSNFDQCQDLVKRAFDDQDFRERIGLNSANSINIARLLAQVTYYFEAAAQLPAEKRGGLVFSVPCGNFGDITAGLIAKALGLKCRFAIACNANDTVPRYLKSGKWDPHPTIQTLSNAMDISRPNNWPRTEALVKMEGWSLSDFAFGSLDDEKTEESMREVYAKTGYITEPHAAIALAVLKSTLKEGETGVFLGTAHPAKFRGDVERILGTRIPLPMALQQVIGRECEKHEMKPDYDELKSYVLKTLGL